VKKPARPKKQRSAPKRAAKKSAPKAKAVRKQAAKKSAAKTAAPHRAAPAGTRGDKWSRFVEQHGVVLASARGPVPSVAEAVAGEPIVGSWWSHPKAHAIFDALSSIDDSDDVRCFKLVDKKVTLVHRRVWPALVKLAKAGVIPRDRVESIVQEHMPTGEHRNFTTPFPDWVPDEVSSAADALSLDEARAQLGAWV
jgi:hypothetical protein